MARVTVEDCVLRVPNRFDLVMLAAQRGRALAAGAPLSVDRDNDKNPVVALREIADGTINLEVLANDLIKGHQRLTEPEEAEEEVGELMTEPEWARMSDREEVEERLDAAEEGEEDEEDVLELDQPAEDLGPLAPGGDGTPFD